MTRPPIALLLIVLAAAAIAGLGWGAKNALEKSDDLLRRAEEAALFVRGEDPYRDPDMTYPPSAPAIFAPLVAPFGVETLKKVWLGLNLAALGVVGVAIVRIWGRDWPTWVQIAFFLVIAASKPTRLGIGMGQFALLPTALMLVAALILERRPILAGVLIGIALAKPTMALPLLGFLGVRRRWSAMVASALVQVVSALGASAWLRISPIRLTSEWLALAREQQGAGLIDVPTIAGKLFPAAAVFSGPISLVLLLACFATTFVFRRRSDRALVGFCLLAGAFFTYHRPYDLVLMFPALASLVAIASENRKRWGVAGSIVVSLALLWPSKPGAGTAGENVYEIAFVTVSYLLLGLILYGLRRALPGEPPEAGGIAEG